MILHVLWDRGEAGELLGMLEGLFTLLSEATWGEVARMYANYVV